MWQAVRRELARLEWEAEPPLTLDLMADWAQTGGCQMVCVRGGSLIRRRRHYDHGYQSGACGAA